MVGGEEKRSVTSAPQPVSTAVNARLFLLLLLFAAQTRAQTAPPIGLDYSFGARLLKPNLAGDVYEVEGRRFLSPRRLKPYFQASGDEQAIAAFGEFQRERRKGHLLEGVGSVAAVGAPILFIASILTAAGIGPSGRSTDSRWMLYSSGGLLVGSLVCGFAAKRHHRRAYQWLHWSIDRYNGYTRPLHLGLAPVVSPGGVAGGRVVVSF